MFTKITILAISLGFLYSGETLECYKCSAFGKDEPSECQYADDKTKTMTCADDEKYCSAIGYKYEHVDGKTTYTNIRRCDDAKYTCMTALYAFGDDNLRNCQVCATDKCNIAPLLSKSELLEKESVNSGVSNPNDSEEVPEGANADTTGGAETDNKTGEGVNSK